MTTNATIAISECINVSEIRKSFVGLSFVKCFDVSSPCIYNMTILLPCL